MIVSLFYLVLLGSLRHVHNYATSMRFYRLKSFSLLETTVEDVKEEKLIDVTGRKDEIKQTTIPHQNIDEGYRVVSNKFYLAWSKAIKNSNSDLQQLLLPNAVWDNPFVSKISDYLDSLRTFTNFFQDPSLVFFSTRKLSTTAIEVDFQLSFWYPMFWRPRVVVTGRARVEHTPLSENNQFRITRVQESWDQSVADLFLRQFLPRAWDVFHLFSTPVPEHTPSRSLGRVGDVNYVEFAPSLCVETQWRGPAGISGPPLLAVPDMSLFGALQTARPFKDPFYPVLPVEVRSGSFACPATGELLKESRWLFPVPSLLLEPVMARLNISQTFSDLSVGTAYPPNISDPSLSVREVVLPPQHTYCGVGVDGADEGDEGPAIAADDYTVGALDTVAVMASLRKGSLRGNYSLDYSLIDELAHRQIMRHVYRLLPRRVFAQKTLRGTTEASKIKSAFLNLQKEVRASARSVLGADWKMADPLTEDNSADDAAISFQEDPFTDNIESAFNSNYSNNSKSSISGRNGGNSKSEEKPWLGLQLHSHKVCFNGKGQPAMAVYEQQYGLNLLRVQVELLPATLFSAGESSTDPVLK